MPRLWSSPSCLLAVGVAALVAVGCGTSSSSSPAPADDDAPKREAVGAKADSYVRHCRDQGVPVPKLVLDEHWVRRGEIANEFLFPDKEAELWSYQSASPAGTCLALPRWDGETSFIFDVICLGTVFSKACFFENPPGTHARRGKPKPIEWFWGGERLSELGKGSMCTDCHAGENPFVVHPEAPAFLALLESELQLMPAKWYQPLVAAEWFQNPEPVASHEPVSEGQKRCTGCHVAGHAGRFPRMAELSRYCTTVLGLALERTMPADGEASDDFAEHAKELRERCGSGRQAEVGLAETLYRWWTRKGSL